MSVVVSHLCGTQRYPGIAWSNITKWSFHLAFSLSCWKNVIMQIHFSFCREELSNSSNRLFFFKVFVILVKTVMMTFLEYLMNMPCQPFFALRASKDTPLLRRNAQLGAEQSAKLANRYSEACCIHHYENTLHKLKTAYNWDADQLVFLWHRFARTIVSRVESWLLKWLCCLPSFAHEIAQIGERKRAVGVLS